MEIEKPFKCSKCTAQFINEDHLSVHKRRHEMSLTLRGGVIEGFVDETPTPTRFLKNCEEVGLFQDLQNVNPFDESFAKATSTPTPTSSSSGGVFDFNSTKRRKEEDQDTLNTPQVFGYLINAASSSLIGGTSKPPPTPQPQLKLNLSSSSDADQDNDEGSSSCEKKSELLERNKAAAARSREKRRQWVLDLERRVLTLEQTLVKVKAQLSQEQNNNQILLKELEKHANCDVTKDRGLKIILLSDNDSLTPLEDQDLHLPPPPKRGRPRKGEERGRRGEIVIKNNSNLPVLPPNVKLPLPPLSSTTFVIPNKNNNKSKNKAS